MKTSGSPAGSVAVAPVGRALWLGAGILVVASAVGTVARHGADVRSLGRVRTFLALSGEGTLPNWWSTVLMLVIAALCVAQAGRTGAASGRAHVHWRGIGMIFVVMSAVEATVLRESLLAPARDRFDLSGLLYFAWVVPGAIVTAAVVGVLLPFVLRQPPPLRNGILLAGAIYAGGALGLEMVGGLLAEDRALELAFFLLQDLEEAAELAGLTLMATTLLRALSGRTFAVRVHGDTGEVGGTGGGAGDTSSPLHQVSAATQVRPALAGAGARRGR